MKGIRWGDMPADYFWHHFPPSYYRDPEEEYEHLGYSIPNFEPAPPHPAEGGS